jgi:mortality factor 4-like protein 1
VLKQFTDLKSKKQGQIQTVQEVMEGIKVYFDRALGTILLYRFERKQFDDIRAKYPNTAASDIYGAEHLLRLFGE